MLASFFPFSLSQFLVSLINLKPIGLPGSITTRLPPGLTLSHRAFKIDNLSSGVAISSITFPIKTTSNFWWWTNQQVSERLETHVIFLLSLFINLPSFCIDSDGSTHTIKSFSGKRSSKAAAPEPKIYFLYLPKPAPKSNIVLGWSFGKRYLSSDRTRIEFEKVSCIFLVR